MEHIPQTIAFYRRNDNRDALLWQRRLTAWLRHHAPYLRIVREAPDLLIVLGGDGVILEAARMVSAVSTTLLGLNLGTVGFLASVRNPRNFIAGVRQVLRGKFRRSKRLMLNVQILRRRSVVFEVNCLNEVYVQNPFGTVMIDVRANGCSLQHIQGTGVLVATPTGSTGYNLSAHGPIVDPSLDCLIITEILDHHLPTPSVVVPADQNIALVVTDFRERNIMQLIGKRAVADVVLTADGQVLTPLWRRDTVLVSRSSVSINIVELKSNYFYHSLHEKFSLS